MLKQIYKNDSKSQGHLFLFYLFFYFIYTRIQYPIGLSLSTYSSFLIAFRALKRAVIDFPLAIVSHVYIYINILVVVAAFTSSTYI